jgi:hypothetical protein
MSSQIRWLKTHWLFPSSRINHRTLASTATLVLLAVRPGDIRAQSPEERAELERFRDSVATTVDSMGLLALEKRMIDSAKVDRSNGMVHLRLGFLSLRLGDLGGQALYDDAASEFQWAIDLQPSWPWAWYGMGLAEYGVGDSQVSFVTGLKTMLGKDALTRSAVAFARSTRPRTKDGSISADLANATAERVRASLPSMVFRPVTKETWESPTPYSARPIPYQA